MEKVLIEKLRNHTCDQIDKDMIYARITDFHEKLSNLCNKFAKDVEALVEGNEVEMAMSGHAVVMSLLNEVQNETPIIMIVGRPSLCDKVYKQLGETLEKKHKEEQ